MIGNKSCDDEGHQYHTCRGRFGNSHDRFHDFFSLEYIRSVILPGSNQIRINAGTNGISDFSVSRVIRRHSRSELAAKLADQICQKLAAIVDVGAVIVVGMGAGEARMIPTVNLHDANAVAIVARPVAIKGQSHVTFPGGDGQKQGNRHVM